MRWTGSRRDQEEKTKIYSVLSEDHILGVGICLKRPNTKALIGWNTGMNVLLKRYMERSSSFKHIKQL